MITLTSGHYIVNKILKNTKAQFFSTLCQGDIIEFSLQLEAPGTGRSGIHATYVTVTNIKTGNKTQISLNMTRLLNNFELVKV